jgi:hypothetical protein
MFKERQIPEVSKFSQSGLVVCSTLGKANQNENAGRQKIPSIQHPASIATFGETSSLWPTLGCENYTGAKRRMRQRTRLAALSESSNLAVTSHQGKTKLTPHDPSSASASNITIPLQPAVWPHPARLDRSGVAWSAQANLTRCLYASCPPHTKLKLTLGPLIRRRVQDRVCAQQQVVEGKGWGDKFLEELSLNRSNSLPSSVTNQLLAFLTHPQ